MVAHVTRNIYEINFTLVYVPTDSKVKPHQTLYHLRLNEPKLLCNLLARMLGKYKVRTPFLPQTSYHNCFNQFCSLSLASVSLFPSSTINVCILIVSLW